MSLILQQDFARTIDANIANKTNKTLVACKTTRIRTSRIVGLYKRTYQHYIGRRKYCGIYRNRQQIISISRSHGTATQYTAAKISISMVTDHQKKICHSITPSQSDYWPI